MTELFTAADADKDGRLNADEWKVWIDSLRAMQKERGEWGDDRMESRAAWFGFADQISPENPGTISLQDFFVVMGAGTKKHFELKDAYDKQRAEAKAE